MSERPEGVEIVRVGAKKEEKGNIITLPPLVSVAVACCTLVHCRPDLTCCAHVVLVCSLTCCAHVALICCPTQPH